MSKTKLKEKSEVEHLKGQLREERKKSRRLRQRIKELEKQAHFYEEVVDEVVDDANVKNTCRNCGKGEILSYDIGRIRLDKCNLCDFEKKVKKSLNE